MGWRDILLLHSIEERYHILNHIFAQGLLCYYHYSSTKYTLHVKSASYKWLSQLVRDKRKPYYMMKNWLDLIVCLSILSDWKKINWILAVILFSNMILMLKQNAINISQVWNFEYMLTGLTCIFDYFFKICTKWSSLTQHVLYVLIRFFSKNPYTSFFCKTFLDESRYRNVLMSL